MYKDKKQTMREKKKAMKRLILSNTFRVILAVFVFSFGVLYVVNTSSISTKGYDMSDLEKQITSLERENQRLEFKIANYSSMQSIQERLKDMDLVTAENIEYAVIVGSEVARR
jgi:cell division protein FtsL